MVRIGLAAPQRLTDGPAPVTALDSLSRWEREQPLLGSFWLAERTTGTTSHLDPMLWGSAIAAATRRARIGTAVVVAPLRHPLALASQAATIDQVSGGRFTLGLGSGSDQLRRATGWPTDWAATLDTYVGVVNDLTSGRPGSGHGPCWHLDGEVISPLPLQRPLPMWLSGRFASGNPPSRTSSVGMDASGLVDTSRCVADLAILEDLVAEAEPSQTFSTAKRVYVHLPDTCPPDHRDHGAWSQLIFGSHSFADPFLVRGSLDTCVDAIAPLVAAGLDEVILDPVTYHPSHIDALLGELVPRLAATGG